MSTDPLMPKVHRDGESVLIDVYAIRVSVSWISMNSHSRLQLLCCLPVTIFTITIDIIEIHCLWKSNLEFTTDRNQFDEICVVEIPLNPAGQFIVSSEIIIRNIRYGFFKTFPEDQY